MATESRRACGYRKVGGLYLVGSGRSVVCDRLPFPLEPCPACGRVLEQNRSHEWMGPEYFSDHTLAPDRSESPDPESPTTASVVRSRVPPHGAKRYTRRWVEAIGKIGERPCPDRRTAEAMRHHVLTAGYAVETGHTGWHLGTAADQAGLHDPICERWTERRLVLWVGRAFYTTETFSSEAAEMGVSRRLTQIPKGLVLGKTWVLLAHPDACYEPTSWGFNWLYGDGEIARRPGVFYAFRPERLELLLRQSDATPERIAKEAARGVTVVAVPDDDKDHQGTVWDKKDDSDAPPLAPEDLPSAPEAAPTRPSAPAGPLERYDQTEGP